VIYEKDNQKVCFIHIPRTGGRNFSRILKNNSFVLTKESNQLAKSYFYKNTEYMHLTYDAIIEAHPKENLSKKIVIVRDPVERFKSSVNSEWSMKLYFKNQENFHMMDDPEYFKYIMKEKAYSLTSRGHVSQFKGLVNNSFSNWFRPQVQFFDESFRVWKFENGFGESLMEFLKKNLDLDINIQVEDEYTKSFYDIKIEGFLISEKLRENILDLYKEDYEFWKKL
jgi:hypothetical protein